MSLQTIKTIVGLATPELGLAQVDYLTILTRVDKRHKTGIMEANLLKRCVTFLSANRSDMRSSLSAIISPATVSYKYRKKLTMEILFSSPTRTCQKVTRTQATQVCVNIERVSP